MSLITIFSAPKPFTDPHIATIQRNAISSWKHLPDVEVLLVGEEAGLESAAREMDVPCLSNVERNAEGTPLVNSIFNLARENSGSPLLLYVNADILLMPDIVTAARQVMEQADKFLTVGQRWDLDVTNPLDFSSGWEERLRALALREGSLHRPAGSDYFIYPRGCLTDIPPFAIGRAGWDNWMIFKARQERWATVDATAEIMIIHQNHDYNHLPGGQPHYRLPESFENVRLSGGRGIKDFRLTETDRILKNGNLVRKNMTWSRFWREVQVFPYIRMKPSTLRKILIYLMQPRKAIKRLQMKRQELEKQDQE